MQGIDISSHQEALDVADVDVDFVIIKATGGTSYVNPVCDRHYQQAKKAGVKRGVYHYAGEGNRVNSALTEADHFVDNIDGYLGDAILALDLEASKLVGSKDPVGWAKKWLDRVHERTGIKPVIYINADVERRLDWSRVVAADYGLWLAQWPSNSTEGFGRTDPPGVEHWGIVALWQFSGHGRIPGYPNDLDLDVFLGDEAAWDAYAGTTAKPAEPDEPEKPSKPAEPAKTDPPSKPAPKPGTIYNVRPGDTLTEIAAWYGTTVAALVKLNGIKDPDVIFAGQKLRVAAPRPAPAGYITIKAGDTLTAIATRHGTTVARLAALNGIKNPDRILAGAKLRIR